jgi:hypothetical protein
MSSAVSSRASQRGFQPSFLLLPTSFFGLRSFLERLELSLNVRSVLFVLPTGRIQGALRLVDGLLPPVCTENFVQVDDVMELPKLAG